VANDEGAKSAEADLARLAGPVGQLSKNKCRAFWTAPLTPQVIDAELLAQWRQADAPRPIAGGRFLSRPGVFAWDRIDAASALLARHLPADLRGEAADLGAGFGYLAAELLARCAGITSLDVFEAEHRALEMARTNLAPLAGGRAVNFHWHDVTAGLGRGFDAIVSNPPFHAQGRADRPDIGRRFIAVAAQALRPDGHLWLVANRHLPYESELLAHFPQVRTVVQDAGFKVIHAHRPA
jgi:16S rRNA (guanine1207-N2)-methyltransferase